MFLHDDGLIYLSRDLIQVDEHLLFCAVTYSILWCR